MIRIAFTALALLASVSVAAAQYPQRPVKVVVPYAAGGGTDVQARYMAARLSERLGQQVVVENNGGAGGNIATAAVTKAEPDCYTLLFIAPAAQAFAIIGDEGVHRKCGDAFWSELAATMQAGFRRADYTGAVLEGIERAGALLAAHFPPRPDDTNELPNQVVER